MKILHLVRNLEVGGAERFVLDLAACQVIRGDQVRILTLCPAEGPELVVPAVLRGHVLAASGRLGVLRIMKQIRPDVAHAHNSLTLFRSWLPCGLLGVPLIMTKHGNTFTPGLRGWAYRYPRHIVCVSPEIHAGVLRRYPSMQSRVSVIPNGIGLGFLSRDCEVMTRSQLGIPDGVRAGIWAGRCVAEKGLPALLAAMDKALNHEPTLPLVVFLAGDGPLRSSLEREAVTLGVQEHVRFLGLRPDIRDVLPLFDFFVMPSINEGMPIALLEAAAAGLPALVSNVGAMPDIIPDGQCGWVAPAGDPAALAHVLERVARLPETELRTMGRAAADRVRRLFSIEACETRYRQIYQNAVGPLTPNP